MKKKNDFGQLIGALKFVGNKSLVKLEDFCFHI